MLRRALRFAAGAAVGIALWWTATPRYDAALAAVTQPLVRIDRRLRPAILVPQERALFITSSSPLPTATIPADQLTYNVILLCALFGSNASPLGRRNLRALGLAALIVFATHLLGLAISIESTYALRQGDWSDANYGDREGNFWLLAELVFRTVGMFGVVFGAWWGLSDRRDVTGA